MFPPQAGRSRNGWRVTLPGVAALEHLLDIQKYVEIARLAPFRRLSIRVRPLCFGRPLLICRAKALSFCHSFRLGLP